VVDIDSHATSYPAFCNKEGKSRIKTASLYSLGTKTCEQLKVLILKLLCAAIWNFKLF